MASPLDSTIAADVVRTEYPNCAEGTEVVLYTLLRGGHSWPGGKPPPEWRVRTTNTSIDATRELREFFQDTTAAIAPVGAETHVRSGLDVAPL